MTNRPRAIGTAAESAVVKVLRANGWPGAERTALHGRYDVGDITGTPLIAWEVKAGAAAKAAVNQPATLRKWRDETETERRNASADIGVLILQRAGFGPDNAGRWWAVIPWRLLVDLRCGRPLPPNGYPPDWIAPVLIELVELTSILRAAKYGTAPDLETP